METKKLEIKTFFNRIIIEPHKEQTDFMGLQMSEQGITGTQEGTVIAVADNIEDIKVGDVINYSQKAEEILINDKRYHIIGYQLAYWK